MVPWNRRVAVVGIGQTIHRSRRPDVNQVELINEAVRAALEDAQLTPKDIDLNVVGNMELFEGVYQPDMWHIDGYGGYLKPGIRMTTGGTTGGMLCCSAINMVASGAYDVAMAIGFEKQREGHTTTGITNQADALWSRWFGVGAIGGYGSPRGGGMQAAPTQSPYGDDPDLLGAKLRVQIADNAAGNPYAQLRQKLTVEDVMNSRILVWPGRLLHMCPQSDGAACVIFASEERAKQITDRPVWIKDHITVHHPNPGETSQRTAAKMLYERNGITDPLKEISLLEMYDPSVWAQVDFMTQFLLLPPGEAVKMVLRGDTARDGAFPINPSGGVVATNAIGATAMLRMAEAALQVRGDAGEHQVTKEVNLAMASSLGGLNWTILFLLSKSLD